MSTRLLHQLRLCSQFIHAWSHSFNKWVEKTSRTKRKHELIIIHFSTFIWKPCKMPPANFHVTIRIRYVSLNVLFVALTSRLSANKNPLQSARRNRRRSCPAMSSLLEVGRIPKHAICELRVIQMWSESLDVTRDGDRGTRNRHAPINDSWVSSI